MSDYKLNLNGRLVIHTEGRSTKVWRDSEGIIKTVKLGGGGGHVFYLGGTFSSKTLLTMGPFYLGAIETKALKDQGYLLIYQA